MTNVALFPKCPNLGIEPWFDPINDPAGHDPRSEYVERYWLAILGPSTMWLVRHLANELDRNPTGFKLDMRETARSLGMGVGTGQKAPFIRSIERTCRFGAARFVGPSTLAVRRTLPTLSSNLASRLPSELRREHREVAKSPSCRPSSKEIRGRARQLALTLLQLGEDLAVTEHQLQRWHFHPAVAHEATRWAFDRYQQAGAGGGAPGRTGSPATGPAPSRSAPRPAGAKPGSGPAP